MFDDVNDGKLIECVILEGCSGLAKYHYDNPADKVDSSLVGTRATARTPHAHQTQQEKQSHHTTHSQKEDRSQ